MITNAELARKYKQKYIDALKCYHKLHALMSKITIHLQKMQDELQCDKRCSNFIDDVSNDIESIDRELNILME